MRLRKTLILCIAVFVCLTVGCSAGEPGKAGTAAAASDEPVDANWTIRVDQTIPVEKDGMTVNYKLVLVANKQGGTDVYGKYSGHAQIKVEMDASKLTNDVIKMLGGFKMEAAAEKLELEVVPHDAEAFQQYFQYESTDIVFPLKPVRDYNGMALITPDMKGAGTVNPMGQGVQGEKLGTDKSVEGVEAMPMRILISDLDVLVEVPALKLTSFFKGQITGVPTE